MFKNAVSIRVDEMKKNILYPGPDTDQSQNLTDWSVTKALSFHKIYFKFVNNFLRYPGNKHIHRQTDRQTDRQGFTVSL